MKKQLKAPQALLEEAKQIMRGSYHTTMWPPGSEPLEILDVGACFGAYTVWACEMFGNAQVTCFEPNPEMVAMLRDNLEVFGYTDRVQVRQTALSNRTGVATLQHGVNPGCTTITPDGPMSARVKDLSVQVQVEDAALLPILYDIIKVGTEGSEVDILGAIDLSATRLVAYEFHRRKDMPVLDSMMRAEGFTLARGWLLEPDCGTMIWLRTDEVRHG